MILRILIFLALLGFVLVKLRSWFGPRIPPRKSGSPVEAGRKCPECDAWVVGAHPQPCGRPNCAFR